MTWGYSSKNAFRMVYVSSGISSGKKWPHGNDWPRTSVADEVKRIEAELLHHLDLILSHQALGITAVFRIPGRAHSGSRRRRNEAKRGMPDVVKP